MRTKTFPARIKLRGKADGEDTGDDGVIEAGDADTTTTAGQFEALVSVFGVKDSYGEVVMPGAFARTLSEWEASGDPIPVYWSHRMDDPDFNIGHVLEAKEIDEGLYIKAQLDLDNAKAKATHNLLKNRRVTQFSFSFNVPPGGMKEGEDALELTDLDLYEVGPTPVGANPATELIGVKAGRVLSEKNIAVIKDAREAMKGADSALAALLKIASGGDDDEEKSGATKVKDEGRLAVKSEEPVPSVDSVLAFIELESL